MVHNYLQTTPEVGITQLHKLGHTSPTTTNQLSKARKLGQFCRTQQKCKFGPGISSGVGPTRVDEIP